MEPTPSDPFLLFVYGTLKRGGIRHGALTKQRFLSEVRTRPLYCLFDLGFYPGLTRASTAGQVIHGELYQVALDLRSWLDRIEGAPTLFRLEPIELDGNEGPAFAYFFQQSSEGFARCFDGVWHNP